MKEKLINLKIKNGDDICKNKGLIFFVLEIRVHWRDSLLWRQKYRGLISRTPCVKKTQYHI